MQISAMGTIINEEQRKEVAGRKRERKKKKVLTRKRIGPRGHRGDETRIRCRVSEIPEIGQLSKPSSPTPISFKLERSFRERGVYFTLSNFNDRGCGYSNGRKIERERTNGRWSLVGHRDGIGNRRQRPSLNEKLNVAAYVTKEKKRSRSRRWDSRCIDVVLSRREGKKSDERERETEKERGEEEREREMIRWKEKSRKKARRYGKFDPSVWRPRKTSPHCALGSSRWRGILSPLLRTTYEPMDAGEKWWGEVGRERGADSRETKKGDSGTRLLER